MRTRVIGIILGIIAFFTTGALSYLYLANIIAPSNIAQEPFVATTTKKEFNTLPAATKKGAAEQSTTTTTKLPTTKQLALKPTTTEKVPSQKVIAPGPLRVATEANASPGVILSVRGVILDTNNARALNGGLPALIENETLKRDAQLKLEDMFAKQYFEHISPTGIGPSNLADTVGYAYVIVGENLALGDFESDQALVDAWMKSPGHRANILNSHYQEIGVAVGKGMYEGRITWLAVQSFGMPRSACPIIDEQLRAQIDANNITIASLRAQLDAKKAQIDATPQGDPSYNQYVREFNALVPSYNSIVETNRVNVENYNTQVRLFNECVNAASVQAAH